MQTLRVFEYGRIERKNLSPASLRALERLDRSYCRDGGTTVFDWQYRHHLVARNWVGVVQTRDLSLEILPKCSLRQTEDDAATAGRNLLTMLQYGGRVPASPRGTADLTTQAFRLLDAFVAVFVESLHEQLRRGLYHEYVLKQENARYYRGKLLLREHIRDNAAHRERIFVEFDEFAPDTLLNRILKRACLLVLPHLSNRRVQQRTREALVLLQGVADVVVAESDFDRLHLNRNALVYRQVLDFAQLIIRGFSPTPTGGASRTFSLLFPMERVFEEFVAGFLVRHAGRIGLDRRAIHVQSRGRSCHLLRNEQGRPIFRLKPDILIDGAAGARPVIIDTKWKLIDVEHNSPGSQIATSDAYQMYAYLKRFNAAKAILLYPGTATRSEYRCPVEDSEDQAVSVALLDLGRDVRREREQVNQSFERLFFARC